MNPLTDGSEAACQEASTVNGGAAAALFLEDIIYTIFGFCDGESLLKAKCCCKTWIITQTVTDTRLEQVFSDD